MTEVHPVASDLAEVGRLNEVLSERWAERELPPEIEMPVTLALEEVLSNVIRHSAEGVSPEISVRFTFDPDVFEFEVIDNGAEFNPLELPPFNVEARLGERRAGGMGVHIVKQLADEVRYQYREGKNSFVFRKKLAASAS